MDIIFLDTSIYIAENYFVPSNRVSMLKRLVNDGLVSVVSTEITNREVLRHFKGDVSGALNNIRKNHKVLACFDEMNFLLDRDFKQKIASKAEDTFKDYLNKVHVYSIGYDMCDDVKGVFEKYFNKEKPFGEGGKEKEFPDAFALQMLENYCKQNGLKIHVLSADSDIKEYKSEYLIPEDYKEYFTKKIAEADILEKIKKAIGDSKYRICETVEKSVVDELGDNDRLYDGLFNTEEVSDVEIMGCSVDMMDGFSIVSANQGRYVIELRLRCYCQVKCSFVNLNYATYDREDGVYYGGEWDSETVDGESYFSVWVIYSEKNGDYLDIESFDVDDAIPDFG